MAVEMFSWPSLHERMCRTWGSNSGPLACQANSLPIELPRSVDFGEPIRAVTQELVGLWWLNVFIICDFSRTNYWIFGFCFSSLKRVDTHKMCYIQPQFPLFFKLFKCIFYHKIILKIVECSKLETYKHKTKNENVKAKWNDEKQQNNNQKKTCDSNMLSFQNVIDLPFESDAIPITPPRFQLNNAVYG